MAPRALLSLHTCNTQHMIFNISISSSCWAGLRVFGKWGKKSRSPIFWILNWFFCCCCRYAFRRRPTFNLVAFFILLLSRMLSRMVIQPVACTADPNFSRYENCCRKNGTHADGTHSLILLARLYVSAGFACHLYFGERDPWLQYLKLPAIGFEILKLR